MGVDVSKDFGRWCMAAGGVFAPAFYLLWLSGVPLCAFFMVVWGVGFLCGICAPRFVQGCFGIGLWLVPWIDDIGGGCSTGPWVACSSRSWGLFCIGESISRFGQSPGVSEFSSPVIWRRRWHGERGGLRV